MYTCMHTYKCTLTHSHTVGERTFSSAWNKLSKTSEFNYQAKEDMAQGIWEMFHSGVPHALHKYFPIPYSATFSISSDKYCSKK